MTNAIIGARGEMAKNLLCPLLSKLGFVVLVDQDSAPEDWKRAWQADAIWLSVPRDSVPQILRGVQLRPEQLVVDICSLKRRLSNVVGATGAVHLSLHPLHGPYVPLSGQKWSIIDTIADVKHNPLAKNILEFLKNQGISFLQAKSEDEHDFMMGVVLSLPELLTIVIDDLLKQYASDCKQQKPDMKSLMEWAVPASNAFFSAYIHSINSSADWLRKDMILGGFGNVLESAKKAFANLNNISIDEIDRKINEQRKFVENLPLEERTRIRQWIGRWFVDSTQKIFAFHKKISLKPKITIQYHDNLEKIFPKNGKTTIGIHGIAGCFTHESILRFCEEAQIDSENLELKYLIDAEGVMDGVANGKVERGVFCIANSGSGAYVSSVQEMGRHNFEVLAVYGMEIMQCLVAHPSVKKVEQIKEIFGHPQAISQCKRTFAEKYPQIKLIEGQDSDDTALCAKRIAEGQFPPTTATLCSQVAAKLYGLNILEYGMHHDPFNTTTFIIIRKKD